MPEPKKPEKVGRTKTPLPGTLEALLSGKLAESKIRQATRRRERRRTVALEGPEAEVIEDPQRFFAKADSSFSRFQTRALTLKVWAPFNVTDITTRLGERAMLFLGKEAERGGKRLPDFPETQEKVLRLIKALVQARALQRVDINVCNAIHAIKAEASTAISAGKTKVFERKVSDLEGYHAGLLDLRKTFDAALRYSIASIIDTGLIKQGERADAFTIHLIQTLDKEFPLFEMRPSVTAKEAMSVEVAKRVIREQAARRLAEERATHKVRLSEVDSFLDSVRSLAEAHNLRNLMRILDDKQIDLADRRARLEQFWSGYDLGPSRDRLLDEMVRAGLVIGRLKNIQSRAMAGEDREGVELIKKYLRIVWKETEYIGEELKGLGVKEGEITAFENALPRIFYLE